MAGLDARTLEKLRAAASAGTLTKRELAALEALDEIPERLVGMPEWLALAYVRGTGTCPKGYDRFLLAIIRGEIDGDTFEVDDDYQPGESVVAYTVAKRRAAGLIPPD